LIGSVKSFVFEDQLLGFFVRPGRNYGFVLQAPQLALFSRQKLILG
jgi:hypothetical protein